MAALKTQPTDASVEAFIASIAHEGKRRDSAVLEEMMTRVTGLQPVMWGENIVGYGAYEYKRASGWQGNWFKTGFSPRKQAISIYVMDGVESYSELLENIGKYRNGRSCLYINKLADVDLDILEKLIARSDNWMTEKYE